MNRDKDIETLRTSVEKQEKSVVRACDAVTRVVTTRRMRAVAKANANAT